MQMRRTDFKINAAMGTAPGGAAGGAGAGKLLFGCMAVMVMGGLVLAVLLGAGFFVMRQSVVEYKDKAIKVRDKLGKLQEEAERMKESAEQAAKQAESMKDRAGAASPAAMRDAISKPVSEESLRGYITLMTAWDDDPAAKAQRDLAERLKTENAGKDGLESAGLAMEFTRVNQDASLAFERLAEPLGGVESALNTGFQVIALVSAARHIDAANPATAKTAAAMLAAQPERKKRYDELMASRDKFLKMTVESDDPSAMIAFAQGEEGKKMAADQQAMDELIGKDPGYILLAKLSPEALRAWSALSDKERAALNTKYARLPDLPLLGGITGQSLTVEHMAPVLAAVDQMGALGTEQVE
jgi:hypothetical protein